MVEAQPTSIGRSNDERMADRLPSEASMLPNTALTSPDLYRALLDSMTEGVSLSDETGTIVYTNPAEDALFGYAPGELVGQHVSIQNAYPEEENQRRVADVIAHLRLHGSWHGEWLNRRKDASAFLSAARITAVAVNGRQHWLCVQRDVTAERAAELERTTAEARLRESEARFRNMADNTPVICGSRIRTGTAPT
jgi:PAS domain S-box-containing protein